MRRGRCQRLALALGAVLAAGCGDDFVPASYLEGLRILAVRAEPAEVAENESAELRAFAIDTDGRPITIDWAACHLDPPPGAPSVPPACITEDSASFLEPLGSGERTQVTLPPLTQTDIQRADYTGGIYLPVRLRLGAGAARESAVYGVRYALGLPPNENPTLTGIFVVRDEVPTAIEEGQPLVVRAGEKVTLRATLAPGSAQGYLVFTGDPRTTPPEQRTELPTFEWYATAGDFSRGTTGEARPDTELDLSVRPASAGTLVRVIVVTRDERGGADWIERAILVQ